MRSILLKRLEKMRPSAVPAEPCRNRFLPCHPTDSSLLPRVGRSQFKVLRENRFSRRVEPLFPAFPKNHPANWPVASLQRTQFNTQSRYAQRWSAITLPSLGRVPIGTNSTEPPSLVRIPPIVPAMRRSVVRCIRPLASSSRSPGTPRSARTAVRYCRGRPYRPEFAMFFAMD
jgi:hypothetical protein